MIIAAWLVLIMCRILVDWLLLITRDIMMLNHFRLPPPGGQLELLKILMTLVIAGPIVGLMLNTST